VDEAELGRGLNIIVIGRERKYRPVDPVLPDGIDKDLLS
jgi:hypothetical protein